MGEQKKKAVDILARNCALLKNLDHASDAQMAKREGIAPKTVNNLINKNTNPTLSTIEAVARTYGVEAWQLLHEDFVDALPSEKYVAQMAKALQSLSDGDFAAVLRARQKDE